MKAKHCLQVSRLCVLIEQDNIDIEWDWQLIQCYRDIGELGDKCCDKSDGKVISEPIKRYNNWWLNLNYWWITDVWCGC